MESVISAIVSPIIDSIVTPLIQQAKYLLNTEANVTDLEEASKELSLTKDEVLQQIETATSTSDEIVATERVKTWMKDIESIETNISKIIEDYDGRTTCFGGHCTTNCWSSYRISKRAANAAEGVKELIERKQNFNGLTERRAPPIRRLPTLTSDATTDSTNRYLTMVFDYLQDEEVGMVGIWGMGGVGKTTLLQKINNHPFVASAGFDYVILLGLSQDLDLDRLQKETAKRLGLTFEEDTSTLDSRAQVLYWYLKSKSFLLLLDNIWDPLELARLGIPCPMYGSSSDGIVPKRKVLFTTRSETTCEHTMACQKLNSGCRKIKIECLQPEEAWKLFLHNIGEETRTIINTDKRVCSRAEKVAEKCGGLPLAIAVIAQAMSANKTWQEWEVAINSLKRIGIQEMWNKEADPFPLLKVSYDRLPNDNVKNCFLSCALWQTDIVFWEPTLINFWISMNVVDDSGDLIESYSKGYAILQTLKRACLLEENQGSIVGAVKMHDVMHRMALWIISECKKEWIIIDQAKRMNESDEDEAEWTTRDAKTISLIHGRPRMQLPQHPDCPNLSALILNRNFIDMIPDRFFQNMNALTFLDIAHNKKISEIPSAIGGLSHLRYLDLSFTSISSLPMELGNLIQLKRLSVNGSRSLRSIPHGLISRLQKLAQLELLGTAFNAWDTEGQASIEELVCSRITSLEFDVRRLETLEQLSKNRLLSLWVVAIRELEGLTILPLRSLLRNGNTRCTLLDLVISDCEHLEEISISSQSEEEFNNLERVYVYSNPALKKITSAGGSLLRNVRQLFLQSCHRLKNATWIVHLPYLESLEILACIDMEHVIADEEDDNVATERSDIEAENMVTFPKLRHLRLAALPELRSFATRAFSIPPSASVVIVRCKKFDASQKAKLMSS